jgi:hypothetical protein
MNDRDTTIKAIKTALQRRSGKAWSVTGGRGTAWGWITINAPPKRKTAGYELTPGCADIPENYARIDDKYPEGGGYMTLADKEELRDLLGLERMHDQGESVAASGDYYREYIARAEGKTPAVIAQPYWD